MSEPGSTGAKVSQVFAAGTRRTVVVLPFALEELLDGWAAVRRAMRGPVPEPFTRDEWAYLMAFVGVAELRAVFTTTFGEPAPDGSADAFAVPRGPVAVWLPNNVTLLGPLLAIMLSLTGAVTTFKVGSRAEDLTGAFVEWLRAHAPTGPLGSWAREHVGVLAVEHGDPRNKALAREAAVRIAFGSDEGVDSIEALAHPAGSQGFAFGDRRSEAWVSSARAMEPEVCDTLVRVFAIYGQAGCTAPRRVVVIDGSPEDARALRDRLIRRWSQIVPVLPAMHTASANLAASQQAAAGGWEPVLVDGNRAMVACGPPTASVVESAQSLFIASATTDQAVATAPVNLQTVGHALEDPESRKWIQAILRCGAERFVPLARMHHFGPVWDGFAYWRGLFREVEVAP
jgi:Acyl-CoA reductase (LuxC)